MSTPWRIAGYVLATIAFVATLLNPGRIATLPPVVEAAATAAIVFVVVWLYEGVFIAARWIGRKLAPISVKRPPSDR